MLSMLYFPIVTALATPTPFSNETLGDRFLEAVCDGNLHAASLLTSRWTDETGTAATNESTFHGLQLHADLQLLLGLEVEAEENYRRSQKLIRSPKHALRAASCRNAAWQTLFRYRLATALSCFARVIEEPGIEVERVTEARFGMACALHELGRFSEAADALNRLAELVNSEIQNHVELWRNLIETLRFDFAVQTRIRCTGSLNDHVYWQSGFSNDRGPRVLVDRDEVTDDIHESLRDVRASSLRGRIEYLQQLQLATCSDRAAICSLKHYLQWAHDQGFTEYPRTLRTEIAIASLAGEGAQHAEMILEPLHQSLRNGTTGRRQLEYLYCVAKVRQAQGRAHESMQLYGRYALVATQCLREESQCQSALPNANSKPTALLDDVGVRLPARYRRAYSYLLDNLDRRDLSVREVAAEIGVTERALQGTFKRFLGLTPTELIRRQRMERIRAELTTGAYANERGVLGAAKKWGVQNRSTLVNGYRKQFNEAPSETLER